MTNCLTFELGTTEAARTNINHYGIPDPDSWTYAPYSSTRQTGEGQIKGFGFPTFSWTWETLNQAQVGRLLAFFSAATDASRTMYVTTHTDTGYGPQETATGTAIMDRPIDGQGKTMIDSTRDPSYNNVTVTFRRFVEA
jgi:hypothetical protein